jgi:hypothetical protein
MRATLLLADAAQAVEGKLYVLGAGWSVTGPQPAPMAIALKLDVPWDQANARHRWRMELVDADGEAVTLPEGGAIFIEQEFEVGRPPGIKPGTALDYVVAMNITPLPLEAGRQYAWTLTIDGEGRDDWRLPFATRAATAG